MGPLASAMGHRWFLSGCQAKGGGTGTRRGVSDESRTRDIARDISLRGGTIVVVMDLKRRIPLLRWSVWRMAAGVRNINTTGQVGDGREAAAVDYVLHNARAGDIDDVLATIDKFAYEKSILINVGDEKGQLLDAAVRRANPALALELGTYCGYGALRIARAAPNAKVYSVELAEANAANARQIWAHAGVADRVTCVVGTIGDAGRTKVPPVHAPAAGQAVEHSRAHGASRIPVTGPRPGARVRLPGLATVRGGALPPTLRAARGR